MRKIIGSRRGQHLLPLKVQWPVFIACAIIAVVMVVQWWRGVPDTYAHEHARAALLACGVTLMAASGLIRTRPRWHFALYAAGAACVLAGAVVLRAW